MPPSPPHKKHPNPPHRGRKGKNTRLLASIIAGAGIAAFVASVMHAFHIPITTILLTSAPILIGAITLAYMAQNPD